LHFLKEAQDALNVAGMVQGQVGDLLMRCESGEVNKVISQLFS
jgi:hypothetical protein